MMVEMEYIIHLVVTMVFPFACASVGGICVVGGIFARSRALRIFGGVVLCAAALCCGAWYLYCWG